ncbi:hypothetical protein P4H61_22230 [Paenibacillus peoriae]|nr:hypothetical protein [Paenibacillus peoriae]MEC0184208.1 hypothetical protein [Paenibacillus peoriae]
MRLKDIAAALSIPESRVMAQREPERCRQSWRCSPR